MADNSENIFVEFDYQNIIIVDPNKIVDQDGKAKDRLVNHEDLVMYANLECSLVPRTKLRLGIEQNEIQTVSVAKINFLKPGDKKYLDNKYTELFTGTNDKNKEVQPQTFRFYEPQSDKIDSGLIESSLLGITNINFNITTSFLPKITITMQDVRGRALFELGNNSPYVAFFNLPYPSFFLTLKGYYGKAVRYQLMLQNFNARFDNSSGNFEITCTFLTYKFNVINDVSMGYLLATPYMYPTTVLQKNNSQNPTTTDVTASPRNYTLGYQKIKELFNEYKSKGIIEDSLPELTVTQLQRKLDTFIKDTLKAWGEVNMEPLTNIETYSQNLNNLKSNVYYVEDSWYKKNLDTKNPIILKDSGNKVYFLKQTIAKNIQKESEARVELLDILNKYNKLINENPTLGEKGSYKVGNEKVNSSINNPLNFTPPKQDPAKLPKWVNFNVEPTDIDYEKSYSISTGKNPRAIENKADFDSYVAKLQLEVSLIKPKQTTNNEPPPYDKFYAFENKGNFLDLVAQIEKNVITKNDEILKKLGDELNKIIKDGSQGKSGLGFIPTIRNVLAILFANGEAFLRLMDDCHREAWSKRDSDVRKKAILGKTSSDSTNELVYPWPQLIVEKEKDGVKKYDVTYPGDPSVVQSTEGYLFDEWPEIEFVEELLGGLMRRDPNDTGFAPGDKEITTINRLSLNSIEFPISNAIYQNKEEIKFFYEFWERMGSVSNFSRINRGNALGYSVDEIVSQTESTNMLNALGNENVFLIKKLKEYQISPTTIIPILKTISNLGEGESYQKFIRGYYSTPYITNYSKNDFKIFDTPIFTKLNSAGENNLKIEKIDDLNGHIDSVEAEKFDFLDTFPFTNSSWVQSYMSDGENSLDVINKTSNVIKYNDYINTIANYDIDDTTPLTKRPITYFSYLNNTPIYDFDFPPINSQTLNDFYKLRTQSDFQSKSNQLPTEGNVSYNNYSGGLLSDQTTSMINTPYFINAIQKGVFNYKTNVNYPYKEAAYLFLNSLPISTLKEKYKSSIDSNTNDLDYIFATFKKFGAVHRLPYPFLLKYGALWHRYKKQVETGDDILDGIWTDFNYLQNYDPATSASTKTYVFTGSGQTNETRITLQVNDIIAQTTASTINVGFYPKMINDFSFFLNGYEIFTTSEPGVGPYTGFTIGFTNEDIQNGINSGLTVNRTATNIATFGFDKTNTGRTLVMNSYTVSLNNIDDTSFFTIPSVGNNFNQTFNECFKNISSTLSNPEKIIEPFDNPSMYNGSVRTFWMAPNYGWFNNSQVQKPDYNQYIKEIHSDTEIQDNFTLTKTENYSYFDEVTTTFKKDILDELEQLFLKFSLSKYDFQPIDATQLSSSTPTENVVIMQNFHKMFTEMMRIPIDKLNTDLVSLQKEQYSNIRRIIQNFLEYDVLFKYGNPSEYNKQLFLSFTSSSSKKYGVNSIIDPIKPLTYSNYTPNALPSINNIIPLSAVSINYPNAWKSLLLNVGFSEVDGIKYTDSGSTIFDFFIDNNVEFSSENIDTLYPLIKIYATQKNKDGSYNRTKFLTDITNYINNNNKFQDLVLTSTFTKLKKNLGDVSFTTQSNLSSELIGNQGKVEIWESLKSTNDRWIAGYDLKYKTIFEDVLLIDRASRDIGDKVLVDIFSLNNLLTNINATTSLLYYIQSVLQMNHFQVMSLPSFVNFYNVQDPVKNAIPKVENSLEFANDLFGTHPNVDYRNSGPKMVCFYAGKPSEHLQINKPDYAYQDDGIYFQKLDSNTLIDNLVNKNDWGKSNRVVGFTVDMGVQNQGVFTNISVSQDNGKPTSETLQQLTDIANQAGNRKTSTQNVSLYNLYKTRSYGCTVQMMGNAMIQPMMYFNLRHVPMFSGSYMILGVNHNIQPGSFTTQFEGVRQSIFSLPDIDSYIQGIVTNLLKTVFTQVKQEKTKNQTISQNTASEKQNQQEASKNLKPSTSDLCKPNQKYNTYTSVTNPVITNFSYKEMIDEITGVTNNIASVSTNSKVLSKLNYSIWCLLWLNSNTGSGFGSYELNFTNIRLDLKVNNEEKDYGPRNSKLSKSYFCGSINNTESPFAVFDSVEDSLNFIAEYLKAKVDSKLLSGADIKNSQGKINDIDNLAKAMDNFLFTSYPLEDTNINYETTIFPTQQCKDRISQIKSAIQQAEILGL
jgi:hypothetical protein